MESSQDKHWASRYLLDPLNAPEPSEETGPGTSFQTTLPSRSKPASAEQKTAPSVSVHSTNSSYNPTPNSSVRSSNNPYRKPVPNSSSAAYPSPPPSNTSSPQRSRFPDLESTSPSNRHSQASTQIPTSTGGPYDSTVNGSNHGDPPRRRGSSLTQRHPGDQTHRPLDMLRHDAKVANRSPHLKKRHLPGADSIDILDNVGPGATSYHHEGPYDATLLARNTSYTSSPVLAVNGTNQEAIRATPKEMIEDSVTKHRPLDGTAMYPPGEPDPYGRVLNYNEGSNMMIEGQPKGGAYRRWDHIKYLPDDIKGKGEPSYSLEKALGGKDPSHSSSSSSSNPHSHRRILSESHSDRHRHSNSNSKGTAATTSIEMTSSPTSTAPAGASSSSSVSRKHNHSRGLSLDSGRNDDGEDWAGEGEGIGRTGSVSGRLRQKFGSLRGRKGGKTRVDAE